MNNFFKYSLILIFTVAFYLRAKVYLFSHSLWLDECSLAMSLVNNKFIGALEYGQAAPSGFLLISKLLTIIFGVSEYVLRFLPFAASILSIVAFYYLTTMFLKKKHSIILANFLFGVNYYLIYYAQEFKQYSTDVLIAILLLILIGKLNFSLKNVKQALLLGVLFSMIFWFSFISIFIFAGFLTILAFENFKDYKKNLALILPFTINLILYYIFHLSEILKFQSNFSFEQAGFINANFSNFLPIVVENVNYFFYPCRFTLLAVVLLVYGCLILFKESKYKFLLLTVPVLALILASYLPFYPIQQRVILFLIPILLVLVTMPLERLDIDKKLKSFVIVALTAIYFSGYFSFGYFKQIGSNDYYKPTELKGITQMLSILSNSDDIIVISPSSSSPFEFYSKVYPIEYKKKIIGTMPVYNKGKYFEVLDALPNGKYWFYVAHDVSHSPVLEFISEWSKANCRNIKKYVKSESYLIYAEK